MLYNNNDVQFDMEYTTEGIKASQRTRYLIDKFYFRTFQYRLHHLREDADMKKYFMLGLLQVEKEFVSEKSGCLDPFFTFGENEFNKVTYELAKKSYWKPTRYIPLATMFRVRILSAYAVVYQTQISTKQHRKTKKGNMTNRSRQTLTRLYWQMRKGYTDYLAERSIKHLNRKYAFQIKEKSKYIPRGISKLLLKLLPSPRVIKSLEQIIESWHADIAAREFVFLLRQENEGFT